MMHHIKCLARLFKGTAEKVGFMKLQWQTGARLVV